MDLNIVYDCFHSKNEQNDILTFIQNNDNTIKMILNKLTEKDIIHHKLYDIIVILDLDTLYKKVIEHGIKIDRTNIHFTIKYNNYKWYDIFQRHNILDHDSSFDCAICRKNINFIRKFIDNNYTVYCRYIMYAIERNIDSDIIVLLIRKYNNDKNYIAKLCEN